jgi:hypothetical protein
VDQQVQWLLTEKLLRVRSGEAHTNEDVITRRSRALAAFGSTLEALRYVHAITDGESVEWGNKMWRAIGLEPPGESEPGTIRMAFLGDGEPPRADGSSLIPQYPRRIAGP